MRIVHLSDIHLSYNNFNELQNHYMQALIDDLKKFHNNVNKIDLIVITGDLIDKGGFTLYKIGELDPNFSQKYGIELDENIDPYLIFQKVFIEPIATQLQLSNKNFLFVPGNHDVDDSKLTMSEEINLIENLDEFSIRRYLNENAINLIHSKRIEKFKSFEQAFHQDTENYKFSNNQSSYIYISENIKYGFILLNDSWRCKQKKYQLLIEKEKSSLYLGEQQIIDGISELNINGANINICLMHHSIDDLNDKANVTAAFLSKGIQIILYGHYHDSNFENIITPKSLIKIRCRSSLNKTNETNWTYIPGYLIIDLSGNKLDEINYRYYNFKSKKFLSDNENGFEYGIDNNNGNGYILKDTEMQTLNNLDLKDFFKND